MIHSYQLNGYHIVLDVCSGSVHVVDEVAFDIINLYENASADDKHITDLSAHSLLLPPSCSGIRRRSICGTDS